MLRNENCWSFRLYTPDTPLGISDGKKRSTALKIQNYLSNVHLIGGAHLQCMNNHNAKFEYKGMKTVGVTDYTNQTPCKHFGGKNVYVQHPSKMRKIFM